MAFLHEHIILPLSDILRGEQVHKYLRLLKKAERWTPEQMDSFQQDRLRKLLVHAATEVPFYHDWFHDHGLNPTTTSINQLPIVDKKIMRQEGVNRFAAKHFPEKERLVLHSSGSTGEPFVFYDTRLSYSVNMASKLRTWYQAGYRLGDRYMKISSSARSGKLKILQDRFNRCYFEVFESISNHVLGSILDNIETKKPLFIRSYPDPLYMLALYRRESNKYVYKPKHIMTTGSTLTDHQRETIEESFGCTVIDSYSCEGTPNTYQIPGDNHYHICNYFGIIEVLDNNNTPVMNGLGRVVSTNLWNLAEPFIRYDTQDLVEVKDGHIIRIVGRSSECVTLPDGSLISANNLTSFFNQKVGTVNSYRLVCRSDNTIEVLIVPTEKFSANDKQDIIDYWGARLKTSVSVTIVDSIPIRKNGKFQTIVNETSN